MNKKLILGLVVGFAIAAVSAEAVVRYRDLQVEYLKVLHGFTADDLTASDDLTVGDDATITGDLAVTGNVTVTGTSALTGAVSPSVFLGPVPATEVITAGATITADACGGIKNISSASAVTTGTTNTFTAPAAGNKGCRMIVRNVNASDAITLDVNALFAAQDGANVALAAGGTVEVASTGSIWIQVAAAIDPNA